MLNQINMEDANPTTTKILVDSIFIVITIKMMPKTSYK